MIKENKILAKIKFFLFTLLFLLIFGVVIGLLVTLGLNAKQEEKIQSANKDSLDQTIDEIKNVDTILPSMAETEEPIETVESTIEPEANNTPLKIGVDLPSGIYKLISKEPTAFYRIATTYNADFINIKDNDVFSRFTYIEVNDGDFLTLIDADAIALANSPDHSVEINSTCQNDKYLVGKDIQVGNYNIIPEVSYGFVEITNSPTRSPSAIVLSSYITKPISVTLLEGQYIKISQSKIMLNQ